MQLYQCGEAGKFCLVVFHFVFCFHIIAHKYIDFTTFNFIFWLFSIFISSSSLYMGHDLYTVCELSVLQQTVLSSNFK